MHTFDKNLKRQFFSNDPGDFRISIRSNLLIVPTEYEYTFVLMEFQFKNCPKKTTNNICTFINIITC